MSYARIFVQNRRRLILCSLVGLILGVALAFLFPLEHSATSRLLIIPSATLGVDPYTAIKSAERISENLAQIVGTSSFFEQVLRTRNQFQLDTSRFENITERQRRKEWEKMVSPQPLSGTSLFAVTVYHTDREQASRWSEAIDSVLASRGFEYTGKDTQIKIVDTPVVSRFVSRPNFPVFGFLGLALGAFLGAIWTLGKQD